MEDNAKMIAEWNKELREMYHNVKNGEKKLTNADRIRSMTDEELAQFLVNFKNTFGEEYEGEASCLEWLQSEVEGE